MESNLFRRVNKSDILSTKGEKYYDKRSQGFNKTN